MTQIKIQKKMAKKLYEDGHPITMVPAHLPLNNPVIAPFTMRRGDIGDAPFDERVYGYTQFNCVNKLVGTYPAFYIEAEERYVKVS